MDQRPQRLAKNTTDLMPRTPRVKGGTHSEVVIDLEQDQWLTQPVCAFTRCGAAPSNRGHALAQAQIEPFDKRRIDLPAAHRQDVVHRRFRAQHDAVLHCDEASPPHLFDHLRIAQCGQRHPMRLGSWASRLAPRHLHPVTAMRHDGGEVMRVPIAQTERNTPGRHQLRDLMQHGVGHCQRAVPDLDAQQQFGLRIDRGPDPVGGTRQPLDRLASLTSPSLIALSTA
jgi:hypothetical protein